MDLRKTFGWLAVLAINCGCWWGFYALVASGKPAIIVRSKLGVQSVTIQSSGEEVRVALSKKVTGHDGFTLDTSGTPDPTLTYVSGEGTNTLVYSLSRVVIGDATPETATYDYTDGDVVDAASNALANVVDGAVINNSQIGEGSGTPAITSATIDSAGTTLTCVFDDNVTLSSAAGWTLEFDNYAERILTYTSGSGTGTIVFSISANPTYTAVGTDNDAAPVSTVATLDYDDAVGNANAATFSGQAITNNSTAIPDPDLPEQLDTSLPAHWNATANHTPADAAALAELLDGDAIGDVVAGEVIQLASDGTNYGPLTISKNIKGTAGNEIIIRTDAYASLPAYGSRLRSTDDANGFLALISRNNPLPEHTALAFIKGTGVAGAQHIRLIGIKVSMTGASSPDITYMIGVGEDNGTTDFTNCPTHIGFDRCLIEADTGVEVRDVLRMDATDSFVIGSRFENLHGAGSDGSTCWRTYLGARLKFDNNYCQSQSAATFLGGNSLVRADDITITNNYMTRDLSWTSTQKATGIETKVGKRVLFENNSIENGTRQASAFGAIMIKADGLGGPKDTSHLTIRNCKVANCKESMLLHGNGSAVDADIGPNHDFLVEHCLFYDIAGGVRNVTITTGKGEFERIQVRNVTTVNMTWRFWNENGKHLVLRDNFIHNGFDGFNNLGSFVGIGAVAVNTSWSTFYDVQYNALALQSISAYDNDTTPTPTGTLDNNLFPTSNTAIGFEDLANDDYRLAAGSSYLTASSTGGPIGCDVAALNTIMAGVEE